MNNNYQPKPVDQLTFTDDGMFQAVMHDPTVCSKIVEHLIHIQVDHIDFPELEKTIAPYYTSKGIRMDVYIKDSDRVIDVEMQTRSRKALGKRTRYYQSMIDIDNLMKGDDYSMDLSINLLGFFGEAAGEPHVAPSQAIESPSPKASASLITRSRI